MLCPNCGKDLPEPGVLCPDCGWTPEPLNDNEITEPAPAELTQPENPEPAEPENAEEPEIPAEPSDTEDPADSEEISDTEETADTEEPADSEETSGTEETADTEEPFDTEDPSDTEETADSEETSDTEETADTEAPADSEETSGTEETADAGEPAQPVPEAPAKKQKPVLLIVLGAIAGLLLIIVVCLMVVLSTVAKTGKVPGFISSIQSAFSRDGFKPRDVALTVTDADGQTVAEVDNEQLSYYFWGEYFYFVQSYGIVFAPSLPLSEQDYSEDMTWEDYFLDSARESILQVEGLKAQAAAENFSMPEEYQTQYESTLESLQPYAQQAGFTAEDGTGDVLAYVRDSYGNSSTVEGFQQYLYDSYFVSAYSDAIYAKMEAEDGEISDYFDKNADMYAAYGIEKSDLPDVSVRHILIQPAVDAPEDATEEELKKAQDEAQKEAEKLAKEIYEEWQKGEATEESFAELAGQYSTDGGSSANGGLYEDVYPGQMVAEFNDWCFDPDRKPGDTGIVETSYGYHIMYFSGAGDTYYWKEAAKSDLLYEKFNEALDGILSAYTVNPTDKLALSTPDAVSAVAAQYAANNAAAADSASETGSQ